MTYPRVASEWPGDLPPLAEPEGELIADLVGHGLDVSVDAHDRADHGRDWWPPTIGAVARGEALEAPAVVVRPRDTDDVTTTLEVASRRRVAVVPQGGRSSVVGGASARNGSIALDLTSMSRVLDVDETSGLVTVEAGCSGPDLERVVNSMGLTVGHFPQSFDLSSVGGWIACRGVGQLSNRFGAIDDIVRGLQVVTANGRVYELGGRAPHESLGPDLLRLFVGSEGTLGVITRATLCARAMAEATARRAWAFEHFSDGLEVCRRAARDEVLPAVMRLYDATESRRSFDVDAAVLVVHDEGTPSMVDSRMAAISRYCEGARDLDSAPVDRWFEHRNDVSALAPLWAAGVVVDTIEVAAAWSSLAALAERAVVALHDIPGLLAASVHQSHAYPDGACLYFTFAGRRDDDAAFHAECWDAVLDLTTTLGASIAHHHGVGRQRRGRLGESLGDSLGLLRAMKHVLDPAGIMNPGVLLGEELAS